MAMQPSTIYELRTTGAADNGGGFAWTHLGLKTSYKWTLSANGTDEYFCEASAGGDPSIAQVYSLYLDGNYNLATKATVGSLAVSQWDYGDNDTLGYSTPYVRLADGTDPDSKGPQFIGIGKGGGQDYSQQDAAQATFTNLSTDGAGTLLTDASAGGLFTALMLYNIIYIASGTGFTPGWYTIVGFTDTDNVTIDRSAGAGATVGAGKVGGAISVITDALQEQWVADSSASSRGYIKSGSTFTLTGYVGISKVGHVRNHLKFSGYKTTRGDAPIEADMPYISCGAYYFQYVDYWDIDHINVTGSGSTTLKLNTGNESSIRSCKVVNTSGAFNRALYSLGGFADNNNVYDCYAESTNGTALEAVATNVNFCVAKDSSGGFAIGYLCDVSHCIAYNCVTGINMVNYRSSLTHSTVYNCSAGISFDGNLGSDLFVYFNTISNCVNGMYASNSSVIFDNACYSDWNNVWNCTTNWYGITPGPNSISLDPEFVSAATGDFTPGANMLITTPFPGGFSSTTYFLGAVQVAGGVETAYGHFG